MTREFYGAPVDGALEVTIDQDDIRNSTRAMQETLARSEQQYGPEFAIHAAIGAVCGGLRYFASVAGAIGAVEFVADIHKKMLHEIQAQEQASGKPN